MIQSDPFVQIGLNARRRAGGGLLAPFVWLAGLVATAIAVTVGAVLAVLTAAAVAVIALFAGVLVFLVGLVMRTRRTITPRRRAGDPEVIEAHKVDGAWVAYGWERDGR